MKDGEASARGAETLRADPRKPVLELTKIEEIFQHRKDCCNTLKVEQRRYARYVNPSQNGAKAYKPPSKLGRTAGVGVMVRSCNQICEVEPIQGKAETLGKWLKMLFRMMRDCPKLFPPDDPNLKAMPTVEELKAHAERVRADPARCDELLGLYYDVRAAPVPPTPPRRPPLSPRSHPRTCATSSTRLCCARSTRDSTTSTTARAACTAASSSSCSSSIACTSSPT